VKKAANFRAAVWFLVGMQLHWFLNQNCNLGLYWTNYKLRTNVNSDMFFPPFPFKWNDTVSCIVHIKKRDPNGAVLNGTVGLLLPLDVRDRGRRRFFYQLFSPSFSEKHQKDADHNSMCITSDPWPTRGREKEGTCPSGYFWCGCTVANPASLSPVFPIDIGESTRKKEHKKKGGKTERKEEKKNRAEKREKERKRRRKTN